MRPFVARWKLSAAAVVLVAVALVAACLWGCGDPSPHQLFAAAQEAARQAATDSTARAVAIDLAEGFLAAHPTHGKAPEVLKALAMLTQQRGDMTGAIAQYERLLREYPASAAADEAQFMIGFICEEHLGDFDRARQAYRLVVERYPDSELAENARRLLPNVGRPPEEWVTFQEGSDPP